VQGFTDVDCEGAMKTAMTVARRRSVMKDRATQTSPVDTVRHMCHVSQTSNNIYTVESHVETSNHKRVTLRNACLTRSLDTEMVDPAGSKNSGSGAPYYGF